MAIVTTVIPEVQDIMDDVAERELWIVAKEHERPPFWFPNEGMNARLGKAIRVVSEGRITPNSDQSFTVEGSGGRTYRITESCRCPQGQSQKTRYCYHYVAMCLYKEWQRRLGYTPQGLPTSSAPIRAEVQASAPTMDTPLPLPPVSVDERLAQPPAHDPAVAYDSSFYTEAPPEPEEPDMTADTDPYIPEPDAAPVAVLERPTTAVTPRVETTDLERALTTWTAERAVVQRFLKQELKPNIDYYTLKIGGRESKPSLSKAGAEKVMGWLKLQASFAPDTGTWEMLGRPADQVFYVCTLRTRSGEIVGEGRGARSIKKDGGDINKAIKMAEKSACVSAVLRTGALSDIFTQDLEDLQEMPAPAPAPTRADLRARIWAHLQQQAPDVTGREEADRWIRERTGYALVERHYGAIVAALEAR